MRIQIHITTKTPSQTKSLRMYLYNAYEDYIKLLKENNQYEHASLGYSTPHLNFSVSGIPNGLDISQSSDGKVLRITLYAVGANVTQLTQSTADSSPVPPVGMLVYLLASFRAAQGRPDADTPDPQGIPFQMEVWQGRNEETREYETFKNAAAQTQESMDWLRNLVPAGWYVPFSMLLPTPQEVTQRLKAQLHENKPDYGASA